MEIRNILTYRGRLNFKRLSDADLQLLDCWCKGVIFGPLYIIEVKPMVYSISPRQSSFFSKDFVYHINCKSFDLIKLCNYSKNNFYKYSDFSSILARFPQINILKYVS